MRNIYAALEIGTSRTMLAIGESGQGGRVKIICHARIPSTGVRKSQILDIRQATQSIHSVLREIERKQDEAGLKITIGNAFLAVNGRHIKANPAQGIAQIGGKVGVDEINEVLRNSRSIPIPADRELLDIADQDYIVDDRSSTITPKGMAGRILKLNTLQITAGRDYIQDARTAADAAHLEIREPLCAITCAADAVLEEHERKNGVLVIDLGGGSTGYAVYTDGYLVSTGVVGVGGDHITNDIAHAFQTTTPQAEGMKIREASALVSASDGASARVRVEQGENPLMDNRTVSRRALNTVVNARLMELFTVIRDMLDEQDLMHRLHSGVILTGGGAQLRDIEALARQMFGMSARIGTPVNVDGLEDDPLAPSFATIAGALVYAARNYEENSFLDGILGRFFGK